MSGAAPEALDRSRPPQSGPPRPFAFPTLVRRRLAGGVELLMAPLPGRPLLRMELVSRGGAQHESPSEGGLATLTASLLDEGTGSASAIEIAGRVESLGGSLATSADWDATYLSVGLLAEHAERGLGLVAELVREATFPEHELERLRRQRLAELRRRSAQPGYLAGVQLAAAIYGEGVYGHSLLGDVDSVGRLERARILDFARRHVCPGATTLVAAGDFDPERLAGQCGKALGSWSGPAPAPPPAPRTDGAGRRRVWIVDRPQAPQTDLRIGHAGVPRAHPDFAPLQLLNSVLGGKFTSRLNLSLRERHAVTYGAFSRVTGRRGAGPIVIGAAIANEAVELAATEVLTELERLRREPVPAPELADARDYLLGVFPYTLQTVGGIAGRLEVLAVHSLPDDYHRSYLDRIAAVDANEIQRCANAHLHPERAAVVAVGPADRLAPQLDGLGPVEVVDGGRNAVSAGS